MRERDRQTDRQANRDRQVGRYTEADSSQTEFLNRAFPTKDLPPPPPPPPPPTPYTTLTLHFPKLTHVSNRQKTQREKDDPGIIISSTEPASTPVSK